VYCLYPIRVSVGGMSCGIDGIKVLDTFASPFRFTGNNSFLDCNDVRPVHGTYTIEDVEYVDVLPVCKVHVIDGDDVSVSLCD